MPNAYIQKVAKDTGKSIQDLEKSWQEAKAIAKEHGNGDNYAIITTIFKNKVGLNEDYVLEESFSEMFTG